MREQPQTETVETATILRVQYTGLKAGVNGSRGNAGF